MDGARASFDRLVAEHQGAVLKIARSILRDEHLGADAAQQTFLRLWRALEDGRAPRRTGGWLNRVAVTTALDLLRRRASRTVREEPLSGDRDAGERALPERAAGARELERRFERALERLSEGQRTIFLLRHSSGLSLAEIAETLGVALPTARTQFARACLELQEALRAFRPAREEPS